MHKLQSECAAEPLTLEQELRFERVDKVMIDGIEFAYNNCRKLHMGQVAWSPQLKNIGDRLELWRNVIRWNKGV